MQQTSKYKFNLIETSDTFSPDALNANAETAERELAALAALEAADKAALAAADAALSQTAAANKTALEQSLAALKSTHAADKAALQTAIGSGGKTCRIAYGTYKGDGTFGADHKKKLTFDFKPQFICFTGTGLGYTTTLFRCDVVLSSVVTEWGDKELVWYSTGGPMYHLNANNTTYYYVVIGESL